MSTDPNTYRENYGWLRDMINKFGERGGFDLLASRCAAAEECEYQCQLIVYICQLFVYLISCLFTFM